MVDFGIKNGVLLNYKGTSDDIVIPDGVKIIDSFALENLRLKSVVIPDSVEEIRFTSFADNQLTNIIISKNVKEIGSYAFSCNQIIDVIIPESVKVIGGYAFRDNPLEHLTMSTTAERIYAKIFDKLEVLTIINEGNIIEFLDKLQISGNLESARNIEIKGKPLTEEEIETIKNKFGEYNIKYDTKKETNINSKEDFVIENGILKKYNGKSEDIVIPGGVKVIDSSALENLGLKSVVMPDSLKQIRYGSFTDNLLTNIILSNSVEVIGFRAFANNQITYVIIPSSVKLIGDFAFFNNPLEHLTISTTVEKIGVEIINKLKALTIINDGNIIEFLNKMQRNGNLQNARNIEIQGKSLTEEEIETIKNKFGEYCIKYYVKKETNINSKEDFVIKNGLLIKYERYNKDIVIPDGVKIIDSLVFSGFGLKSVVIPDSVEEICDAAFKNNQLKRVIIPSSVKLIGQHAFYNNHLEHLTMSTTMEELGIDIYNYLENLTIINEGNIIGFLVKLQRSDNLKSVRNIEIKGKPLTEEEIGFIKNKFGEYKVKYDIKEKENINNEEDFVIENGVLIEYRGNSEDVVIPDGVKIIDSLVFSNRDLESVIIPNSVEEICDASFANNQLKNVIIPSGVRLIGKHAFYNNNLKHLTMYTTFEEVGHKIFGNIDTLTIINEGNIRGVLVELLSKDNLDNVRNIEIKGKHLTEEEIETINQFGGYSLNIKEKRTSLSKEGNMVLIKNEKEYQTPINISAISSMAFDLAKNDDLTNALGRDREIEKLIKSLCIKGSSVLLLGDAGVGKTALVENLALLIRNGANKWLKDKIILSVDTSGVVSGAKYVGEFEKKFNDVLNLAREYKGRVILFIDEFHTLYGLGRGEASSLDAMNMLKPLISSRDITVIGATTVDEYQEYIARDKAFVRRFEQIKLDTLSLDLNVDILVDYMVKLERRYEIKFPYNERQRRVIAKYIVEKTDVKYQRVVGTTPTTNPTLAKSLLEDAFVDAVYKEQNSVTIKDICIAISSCDKLSNKTINPLNLEAMLNIMPEDNKVVSFPR